jgi:hypothetical protein
MAVDQRRGRSAVRAAVAAVLIATAPARAAQHGAEAIYRAAVVEYRRDPNPAIERVLALSEKDLGPVVSAAARRGGWPPADLLTAAMLHTDAGFYFAVRGEGPGLTHLTHANDLIAAALDRSPAYEWFDRDWIKIVTKALADYNRVTWSLALGQRRAIRGPMTTSVDRVRAWGKFDEGVEMERLGCEKLALANRIGTEGWGLPAAAALFRTALEHEPGMLDAALHLGRVEMLMNHEESAAALFARAVASTRPSTVYLAELLAGSIDERRERFIEAEAHYRRAAQVFPLGQASVLALAEVLGRTGRAQESSVAIDGLLDRRTRGVVLEPWWTYDRRERVPDLRYLRADVSQ